MDWSKIKTIFIITFFILDVFLGYQFIQKRSSNQIDIALEMSIEDQLKQDEITYNELPKKEITENYISGKQKKFTTEETDVLDNQTVIILDSTFLKSTLNKPLSLPESNFEFRINQFLKEEVISGESYKLWSFDVETRTFYYFQQYKNKTIYNNFGAMIMVHLNEDNQIVSYEQTMLDDIEEYQREEDIIPAIKALEILYKKDLLTPGSHVTKVELGYSGLFLFNTSKTNVLTPAWRIVVDDKEDFYVNALEGQVIDQNQ